MWLLFPSENSVHKVIKALFVFVWMGGLVLSFWGIWGNVWFGSPVFINTLLSAFVLVLWCEQEKIRYHFFSFTVYHVSWNMLLLPSKRVRSGEPAVFHGTCVDPHSSVLVITSRVKCMPSLLAAHTPSRCPFHSSHPKVTFRSLPALSWSQLCGCQSALSPHPHLLLYFSDLIPSLRVTYSPPRPRPGAWISFSLKSKKFAVKCLTVGHFPQLLFGFWA